MTDVITLISRIETPDQYGDLQIAESRRVVFAEAMSVGQKEFYQAQAIGLMPEIKFRMQDYLDYGGEQHIEHEGTVYRVLRTYRSGQVLEITAYREVNP